jgi:Zn-dependent protease/predicted transcriptional regulator
MRGAFRLGHILGIPIAVNYTWFFAIALIAWSLAGSYYPQRAPGFDESIYWTMGVASALLLFASVLVHEFGHALTARRFGIETKAIILFLFGGVAQIANEPPTPRAEFRVAIAGPLTSLALAGVCRLIAPLLGPRPIGDIVSYLAVVNLLLGVFNLTPGFPLDGGRVLRAALWARSGSLERATRTATRAGQLVAMLFIAGGMLYIFRGNIVAGVWLILIGWFLDTGAQASYQQVVVRHGLGDVRIGDIMSRDLHTIEPHLTVERAIVEYFLPYKHTGFPVTLGDHLIGIVTMQDVTAVPGDRRGTVAVRDVMTPRDRLKTVSVNASAYDAFAKMSQDRIGRLPVLDEQGNLAGIVTRSDLLRVLRLRADLAA